MAGTADKGGARTGREAKGVEERVALALSRGTLRQWIQFETEAEVAAARAILARHKGRHLEALTPTQIADRIAKAKAAMAHRPAATAPPASSQATPPPAVPAKRDGRPGKGSAKPARRRPAGPVPAIAAE